MQGKIPWLVLICLSFCILTPAVSTAQSTNAFLRGTVSDPSAAVIPRAVLTLTSQETDTVANFTTDATI
jgi:hypothetical protein